MRNRRQIKPAARHSAAVLVEDTFAPAVLVLDEDPPIKPPPRARELRLLLVEDHANTARAMSKLLEQEGHEVLVAANVAEALRLADSEPLDLILCDIGLPDGTGHDLLRRMHPPRPTPAIALTAHVTDSDCDMCRESGFVAHVPKPVDFAALREMIEALTR
jgi:CheY-like chemotaxis protein